MLWRRWLKWLIVVDTKRQVLLAQEACSGPYNGSAMLRPLTEAARKVAPLGVGYWRTQRIRQRAQPPPRARTARSGECDPGQAGQGNMAASRLPSPNACEIG